MKWYEKKWVTWIFLIICFPIGLLFLWRWSNYETKSKAIITAVVILFLFSVSTENNSTHKNASTVNVESKIQTPKNSSEVQPPTQIPKVTDLGMTFEQFTANYNANLNEFGVPIFNIYNAEFLTGDVKNVYQCNFTENLSLMATVNIDDGNLNYVMLFVIPKNKDDLFGMLMIYGVTISTLNPELSAEQRGDLLEELYIVPDKILQLKDTNRTAIRGNVKYLTSFVPERGIFMLSAGAKDL